MNSQSPIEMFMYTYSPIVAGGLLHLMLILLGDHPLSGRLDRAVATHHAHGLLDARELSKGNDIDTSAAKGRRRCWKVVPESKPLQEL